MKIQVQMMERALAKKDPGALSYDNVAKLLKQTSDGLTRMSRLVEDMLDIGRIQSGKITPHLECTDFVSFVNEAMARFSAELSSAEIPVTIEALSPEILLSIDRFRMEQVLTNFITNAIRYTPILVLSARPGPFTKVVAGYIRKPFDLDDLLAIIQKISGSGQIFP